MTTNKNNNNSQGKPKPKGKPKKPSRTQKRQGGGTQMAGGPAAAGGFSSLPVARSFSSQRGSYFHTRNLPKHADLGTGIIVEGCEVALNVVTAAATSDFFTSGVATAFDVQSMQISPDSFNGRLALTAREYTKFRFRKLVVHFVPALGTANPGIGVMSYSPDPALATFASRSFAQCSQASPSIVFSLNAPVSLNVIDYRGNETYWTELDSTSSASYRQTVQGVLTGFPSTNTLGVLTQGILWVEYVVELWTPSMDYGFTLSAAEQRMAKAFVLRQRERALVQAVPVSRAVELEEALRRAGGGALHHPEDDDFLSVTPSRALSQKSSVSGRV